MNSVYALVAAVGMHRADVPAGNQHTYLLHGLARTRPELSRDWLANTADAQPLFSWLVALMDHVHVLWALSFVQLAVAWTFVYCLLEVVCRAAPASASLSRTVVAATMAWAIVVSSRAMPAGGFAAQYLLGSTLQPSSFGVLLLVAIVWAQQGRFVMAAAAACLATNMHPTYLPSTLAIVAGVMWSAPKGRACRTRVLAAVALLLVPIATYVLFTFHPSGPATSRLAAAILVHERFPHHALVGQWLTPATVLIALIALGGVATVRRSAMGRILVLLVLLSLAGTVVCWLFESDRLALLFPWRSSVVWIPVGFALALSSVTETAATWLRRWPRLSPLWTPRATHGLGVVALVAVGALVVRRAPVNDDPLESLYAAIELQGVELTLPRDSLIAIVPPDLTQVARLRLGRPVFADWKSHPYKDVEVVEWWRRIQLEEEFATKPSCATVRSLMDSGVTHVITRGDWVGTRIPPLPSVLRTTAAALWKMDDTAFRACAAQALAPTRVQRSGVTSRCRRRDGPGH